MARTAVTVTSLTTNAVTASPAGTACDATNDHSISGVVPEELVLRVTNTAAGSQDLTVLAGDSPPALAAGQGNLVESFGAGDSTPVVKYIGPLESGRFVQSDGSIHVDLASGFTGTIVAFHVPRT